ncbi:MAG: hypothetical protein OH316_01405 [Candidatus Parvarchaeota archaeon]|nr:hypothetical protein [Candidatus Parvarchaeota archaeon]
MQRSKFYVNVFVVIIAVSLTVAVYSYYEVENLDSFYAVHTTYINTSGMCSDNLSTMLLFYSSSCGTCGLESSAFKNVTSLFGIWDGSRFYSQYFCAYAVNLTQYDQNASTVFAPPNSIAIFGQLSNGDVPLAVFGGRYYKIGGYYNYSEDEAEIFKYICLAINNSAPQCR